MRAVWGGSVRVGSAAQQQTDDCGGVRCRVAPTAEVHAEIKLLLRDCKGPCLCSKCFAGARLSSTGCCLLAVLVAASSCTTCGTPTFSLRHGVVPPQQLLRLRGGSEVEVGAPLEDVGAPGYDAGPYEALDPLDARPALTDMTVPGTRDNISHAIASASDTSQTILARSGDHRWSGTLATEIMLNGSIAVEGEKRTRLLGRWLLTSAPLLNISSRGSFAHVTCAYATNNYSQVLDEPHALFAIMGGPWSFAECELRAAAADVFACFSVARVHASACLFGGMGHYNTSNGTMLAVGGVSFALRVSCGCVSAQ
jgi:hypothetical protein